MTAPELSTLQQRLVAGDRRSRGYLALRITVRILALLTMLGFGFAFGWFVVKPLPISLFIVTGFSVGVATLFVATRHSNFRRHSPPQ